MEIDALIQELHRLSRPQKYQIIQLLVDDLAHSDVLPFITDNTYEVWSPQDASSAAATLLDMLEQERSNDE